MSATATTPAGIIRPNAAYDAHVPQPNPSDPMTKTGTPAFDDDGMALCPRGRHRMDGDNLYKGTQRCRECKNEDGRKYDPKRSGGAPKLVSTMTAPLITTPPAPAKPKAPVLIKSDYISRDLAGHRDVDALNTMREQGAFVNLYGPPGTGKTALIEAAFPGIITVNGDCDTDTAELVGMWQPTGERDTPFVWSDGPLATAMREGRPIFFDDITLIPSPVLAVLYPAMDGRNFIVCKSHQVGNDDNTMAPEIIHGQPGFYVIAAYNPGAHGSYYPPPLKSRFHMHVHVTSDFRVAEKMGIDSRVIKLARNMNAALETEKARWAPQIRNLKNYHLIFQTLGEDAALANLVGEVPDPDLPFALQEIESIWGRKNAAKLALGKDKK